MLHRWLSHPFAPPFILGAALAMLVAWTFAHHRLGDNVLSRVITVERLVEAGTLAHDNTPFRLSIDSVRVDGKRYSSKPPTYSFIMAAEAWPVRRLLGLGFFDYQRLYVRLLVLLNQVALYGVMLVLAWRLLQELTGDAWTRAVLLCALTFGSLPFGYAVTLNNHTPTAALITIAFYLIYRVRHRGAQGFGYYAGAGLCAGLAASFELTASAFVAAFFALLWPRNRRGAAAYLVTACLPFIPMFATFYKVTGSLVPFYFQREAYRYTGSYWNDPLGNDALSEPKWLYGLHALIGHHGLLSLTPFLLLSLGGFVMLWRRRSTPVRLDFAAVSAASLTVIAYIIATTNNYGGLALGMRWFISFMPLWTLAAWPAVERLGTNAWGRALTYVLLLVSTLVVGEALGTWAFSSGGWVNWLLYPIEH